MMFAKFILPNFIIICSDVLKLAFFVQGLSVTFKQNIYIFTKKALF